MLRRTLLSGIGSALVVRAAEPDLLAIAAAHVKLAEAGRVKTQLWGRIAGSVEEHASARLLARQLRPYVQSVKLESFSFDAHRPRRWEVRLSGRTLPSAMPAPFDARFPEDVAQAPVLRVSPDQDWSVARGKWAFLESGTQGSAASTLVREKLLYNRAVDAGAAGLLFSLPTPHGLWRSIVPVDKAYALKDDRHPDGRRPLPCFSLDADDGAAIRDGAIVYSSIRYEPELRHQAFNTVGFLPGGGETGVAIFSHLDSFFSGANDDATGIAATVGIAHRLSRLPRAARKADFYFVGLSAHHDGAAGMRAFLAAAPSRFARLRQLILLEHLDAVDSELNNQRMAFLGAKGWPEVRAALATLVKQSGVMTIDPPMQDACIADLLVTCGQVNSFCLIAAPPFYHTDHDTLDKIGRTGIEAAVDFHMRLLQITGAIA